MSRVDVRLPAELAHRLPFALDQGDALLDQPFGLDQGDHNIPVEAALMREVASPGWSRQPPIAVNLKSLSCQVTSYKRLALPNSSGTKSCLRLNSVTPDGAADSF